MTFQYTDQQLNELNQEENVYSVNPGLAKEKRHKHITDKEDKLGVNETNEIEIGDQEFRVVSTLNDEATGAQAMAVAPMVNGEPDYNSVAVVAAGTNDPY